MNETIKFKSGRFSSPKKDYDDIKIPSLSCGLSFDEVMESRKKFGSNLLTPKKQAGFFRQFLHNLNDPIIKILIAAMVINTAFTFSQSNWAESAGIAITVLISTFVTTLSEHSSGASFEKLYSTLGDTNCRVIRNGSDVDCPISELVKYDLVYLYPGDTVPADGVILRGQISCDESPLTGESRKVQKLPAKRGDFTMQNGDPSSVFRGSHVASGNAVMLVLAVGDQTLYGSIATELASEESVSPLKNRLSRLAKTISKIGYVSAVIVAVVHLTDAFWFDAGMNPQITLERLRDVRFLLPELIQALTLAISIVVVAVPEGLPMMITVVLSSNMKRMLKAGVLVRRLVGIETAGNMDILFTDKTGTLTTGQLKVAKIVTASSTFDSAKSCPNAIRESLTGGAISCSSSNNATERAINSFLGCTIRAGDMDSADQIPFDSSRKFAAARYKGKLYIRGAAEYLLPACDRYCSNDGKIIPMSASLRENLSETVSKYASSSFRILLHAESSAEYFHVLQNNIPNGSTPLAFIALYVIRDEIRQEVIPAVAECRNAGIQVVMITGDNAETAAGIAAECGIIGNTSEEIILDGSDMRKLSDDELTEILPKIRVISRVTPTDKSRLVKIAKAAGHITGMTGDGVNDAPALKAADVGFAMGSGTDIAREAGDIVITDDNFVSITKAVLYGRTIFSSIRKFITFQLTMNLSAVGVSVLGTMFGIEHPVTVIQMLWVNIIMDTLGSLAFAGEPALSEYMKNPPVARDEHILTLAMVWQIVFTGSYAVALSMFFLFSPRVRYLFGGSEIVHLTQFFALFIFMGIGIAMCTRTPRINLFANLSKNRAFLVIMSTVAIMQLLIIYFGGEVFRCVPLSGHELLLCGLFAFTVIPVDTIRKALRGIILDSKNNRQKNI